MAVWDGPLELARSAGGAMLQRAARVSSNILTATDGRDVLLNTPDGWEVDQPWLWWLGPAGTDGSGGPWGNPLPGAGDPASSAARIPAVGRATSLIVDTIAGLPWDLYRGSEKLPDEDWVTDPQALRLDGRVLGGSQVDDVRLSSMDFWTQWLTSALWYGDGYIYVGPGSRDAKGGLKPPLYVLNPGMVRIEEGRYWVEDVLLPEGAVIHLRGLEPVVNGHGSGVLSRYAAPLASAQEVRAYADGVFHAGVPAGYLKSSQPFMDEKDAADLKTKWMDAHGGASRSIAILNATTDFTPLTFKPVDSELLGMLQWSLLDVALAFGIPPYMLGANVDSNTYANVESRMIELSRFTLMPWIRRVEATLDAQLPRFTSLKVRIDGLMRADTQTRFNAYDVAVKGGWLTVAEVRELEDLPPLAEDETPAPAQLSAVPDVSPDLEVPA